MDKHFRVCKEYHPSNCSECPFISSGYDYDGMCSYYSDYYSELLEWDDKLDVYKRPGWCKVIRIQVDED